MEDRILLREDYPDVLGDWMWESEYIKWKEYCAKRNKEWEDFLYGRTESNSKLDRFSQEDKEQQ